MVAACVQPGSDPGASGDVPRRRRMSHDAYASSLPRDIPGDVMALLAPHLEPFVDVDSKESRRITEAGIAATTKRVR